MVYQLKTHLILYKSAIPKLPPTPPLPIYYHNYLQPNRQTFPSYSGLGQMAKAEPLRIAATGFLQDGCHFCLLTNQLCGLETTVLVSRPVTRLNNVVSLLFLVSKSVWSYLAVFGMVQPTLVLKFHQPFH